ncbi:hypothetical protein Csa_010879 [Cucumis sativus]|nr:hypothetical protein Csa_010879 [Cucumis sativus]
MATQQEQQPSLRRSLSDSNHRRRRNRRRATISTTSSKSSWSSKLGKLLARLAFLSRDSDLTEESLEAHNKRINDLDTLDKTPKSSPYYRGLTDSSLAINYHHGPLNSTPYHVTYATSAAPSTQSSIVSKFKDYMAPCLRKQQPQSPQTSPRKVPRQHQRIQTVTTATTVVTKATWFSSGSTSASATFKEEMSSSDEMMTKKKLLRERLVVPNGGGRRDSGGGSGSSGGGVVVVEEMEKERYSWGDSCRPKVLEDFICNKKTAIELKEMVKEKGCGHYYIFEGAPGVGKRTMIQAMLRQAFGNQSMEIKEVVKVFDLKSEMLGSIEVKVKESSHYVEVNMSQTKGFEKQVIVQLMKESHSPLPCNHANCRGILLCEADQLSIETLMYIKWAMERYKGCSKIFFCCSDASKLLLLSSLCTLVRLSPPSKQEIVEVLEFIAKQQGFDLSKRLAERIADNSRNNLRQAIRSLEASWKKSQLFDEDENKLLTGWEDDIADVAKKIVEEQSPKQ